MVRSDLDHDSNFSVWAISIFGTKMFIQLFYNKSVLISVNFRNFSACVMYVTERNFCVRLDCIMHTWKSRFGGCTSMHINLIYW
jgi:hypothetical protein